MAANELVVLKAIGALLAYPRSEIRAALPEIAAAIRASRLLRPEHRDGLLQLAEFIQAADPLLAEERYVELFDRGRATSLYLFEHVHGEGRDRGAAMVALKGRYEAAGFMLAGPELPDFLPLVLEYLSCRDLSEAKTMLGECAHILRRVGEALCRRESCYAAAFEALLGIAGAPGLAAKTPGKRPSDSQDLDAEWVERPAFEPVAETGAGRIG